MTKEKEIEEKKMKHYCIDNGHANYVTQCWGYVYCGRCGEQIGDRLAGVFDMTNVMLVGHKCKICNKIRKKLNKMDLKIVKKLEKELK